MDISGLLASSTPSLGYMMQKEIPGTSVLCHSPGSLVAGRSASSTFQSLLIFVSYVILRRFAVFSERNKDKCVYAIQFQLQFHSLRPQNNFVRQVLIYFHFTDDTNEAQGDHTDTKC